jgi:hypothetical protein
MLRTLFKKGWKAARSILRRVRAINTPWGGVQLSEPAPDLSFARAQDEWELRHEIYLLAGVEAYAAKDGARRLGELMVPEVQAVEKYLAENPETRRWVERNIEAGTCAIAVAELRKRKEEFRQARLAERGDVPRREPNPEFDWMRQAARGVPKRIADRQK